MSLADERARDVAEMISDEPVTFKWLDVEYTGKKSSLMPDELQMLDAGYSAGSQILLHVLATQFTMGSPDVNDVIVVFDTSTPPIEVSYNVRKANRASGYYTFELVEVK